MSRFVLTIAITGFSAIAISSHSALAIDAPRGTVRACSAVMKGHCATGAVRNTAYGQQVQLPGGAWVDCGDDCSRKLRKKTVDLWKEKMLQN